MEIDKIIHEVKSKFSHHVVDSGSFGNGKNPFIWVSESGLVEISEWLNKHPKYSLNWLENFSIIDFGDSFLLSYFLRSRSSDFEIVLRFSAALAQGEELVKVPDLSIYWPELGNFEEDARMLFGVQWKDEKPKELNQLLDSELVSPPLRKRVFA